MNDKTRVSVIVPVYNAEKYLDECIGSVLAQSMTDFELLLIDDGSKDSSGAKCDRFAEGDGRIRVFHTPNRGVSAARNLGLDNARGEFVVFVDADDTVTPDHLEQFLQSNISEDGIAFTNIFIWRSAHDSENYRILSLPDCSVGGGREECMSVIIMLIRRRCFSLAVTKMFSRATIEKNGLRFDESVSYGEDEIFAAQYCAHITHIVCNSNPTYHYRYVEGSLSRGQFEVQMRIRIKDYISEQYRRLGYGDEVLYLSARKQFSRLRHGLRHTESWNGELTNEIARSILDNYKLLRTYARREFMREFYDRKAMWIARISCAPNSRFWVKLMIKGLHM